MRVRWEGRTRDGVIGTESHVILHLCLNDVGQEVPALKREILDNEVEVGVRILDARDRDVS